MLDNNHDSRLYSPATTLAAAGLSIIPVGTDKRPLTAWKLFQERPADTEALGHWFISNGTPAAPALAVICGAVSGGLTVLDFDTDEAGATLYEDFATMVEASAPLLLGKLPHVQTPSGGMHVYLRCTRCEGNQQLAVDEMGLVRIETRGQGGYVVAPPSRGYRALGGTLREIPRIEEREYRLLLRCARALSEAPTAPVQATHTPTHQVQGDRPGDAYNARATLQEVASLLCRHGWTAGRPRGEKIPLTRPGKSPRQGTSGDVSFINGIPTFTQFSSNGGPFEPRKGYSAFAVYALLEHGGDFTAAARAIGGAPAAPSVSPDETERAHEQEAPAAAEPGWNWRTAGKTLPEIWAMEFAPPRWFVDGIIAAGTTFLFAAPKTGKSLLAWQIALAAASGGLLFGKIRLAARPVVYICFEDGLALVRTRTMRMLEGRNPPANLTVYEHWRPLGEGGLDDLHDYLAEHPGTDFIIDTFEPFRARERGGNAYREDYAGLSPLAALARTMGSNILVVYHEAKAERADAMMTMSGSLAIAAAVDGQVRMTRSRFVDGLVKLQLVGRGLAEDSELMLQYDKDSFTHTLLGDAEQVIQTRERAAIFELLQGAGQALGLQEIADRLGKRNLDSVRRTCDRMATEKQLLRTKPGTYAASPAAIVPPVAAEVDNKSDSRTVGQQDHGGRADTHTSSRVCPTVRLSDSVPCPGCGHHGAGLPAAYDPAVRLCTRCGCELKEVEPEL